MDLIKPKEITLETDDGSKTYIISKMPYDDAGREVLTQFIPTATPKIGNYRANHELMRIMMSYVAVILADGKQQVLSTVALRNNHIPDFQTGVALEKEMLQYNFGFFPVGGISDSLNTIGVKAQAWITKILMDLQAQSSPRSKRASKS